MNPKMQWLRNKMSSLDLQGIIISNPINIKYLTGIDAEGTLLITRKENIYITDGRYIEYVHSTLTLFDEIIVYDIKDVSKDDYENFFMFCENVGFEENYVTYAKYKEYIRKYKINNLVETEYIIEKQRMIKDDEELKDLKIACEITDNCFSYILSYIKPGMTEIEIAREIEEYYKTFSDDTRVLNTHKVETVIQEDEKLDDITKTPFNVYLSGIDVYGSIKATSRSDVNVIVTVNPNTKQILLTSTPRDYYVPLTVSNGIPDKLTHAGNYGVNMSIDTIKNLLNIDINYYIRVNFSTVEKIIDSLRGVDVYSEYSFVSYIDNYKFYKGYNHMNGKQALAFSRERKTLPSGDIDRGKNQEAVIEAIIRKATSSEIIYNYPTILKNTKNTFQTNLTDKDITSLIKKELTNLGGWNVTSNVITGEGKLDYTYSYPTQKLYVMNINNESLNKTINLINKVINGDKLDSSYGQPGNIKNPDKVIITEPSQDTEKPKEDSKDNDTKDNVTDNTKDPLDDILPDDDKSKDNNDNTSNNNEENNNDNNEENNNDNNEENNDQKDDNLKDILPNEEKANNP